MKKIKDNIRYTTIAIILIAVLTYIPLFQLLYYSFTNWNLLSAEYNFVGLQNYEWLFTGVGSKYLWNALYVTIIYSLGTIFFTVIGGLILAILLRNNSKLNSICRSIIFLPRYISLSASAIIFLWILNSNNGILNQILLKFDITTFDWFSNCTTALLALIFVSAWKNIGYGMLIYIAAMANIPSKYYDSAMLDGANKIEQFKVVTLPYLKPSIIFLTITSFVASMKAFQTIDIMTEGGPFRSTEAFIYLIYRYIMVDFKVGRASAAAIVFFLLLIIIIVLLLKLLKKYSERNEEW